MSSTSLTPYAKTVAGELGLPGRGVEAVLALLDEGSTVPFIARYRKERTGSLDEVQIRTIQERTAYLRDLDERRQTILKSIDEQGKLTDSLRQAILACDTKQRLEDLYLPYKPKRRTKATIARERGLEPLALRILEQPDHGEPAQEAKAYVDADQEVASVQEALAGARDIVIEGIAENAEVRALVREAFASQGVVRTEVAPDKDKERTRFEDYYDYSEPVAKIPGHRILAIRRGETEGVLRARVLIDDGPLHPRVEKIVGLRPQSPFAGELRTSVSEAVRKKATLSVETDVRVDMKLRADQEAVEVFADNLGNLLMAAPLGGKTTVAIDPGLRTGCKCVALDRTGKFLDQVTVYPARGQEAANQARQQLLAFFGQHQPYAIAIGNGTGGREIEQLVRETLKEEAIKDVIVVQVSEAGASVYSASDVAREEFPDLDVTVRGAVSIGRRLQDPLAELVKIDPKSIGVGQYQHDVHQPLLKRKLGEVVESCVNKVGVELNTASAQLMSYVAGVGPGLAKKIVSRREQHGPFATRKALLDVPGLGSKTFEQAAGFLRVRESSNPLDRSAVHPECYGLVKRIATDMAVSLQQLVGSSELVRKIDVQRYLGDGIGEPTLRDIVAELEKPGRDPRKEFEPPRFRDDVNTLEDLKAGMKLEGVVTNVTDFGAFVDIGVHQDGLVHISQLADRFIKHPSDVVKVGDRLRVRVLEVDGERRRISLTARSSEEAPQPSKSRKDDSTGKGKPRAKDSKRAEQGSNKPRKQFSNNPFSKLLR